MPSGEGPRRFPRIAVAIFGALAINLGIVVLTAQASVTPPLRLPFACLCINWITTEEAGRDPGLPPMPPDAPAADEVVIDGTSDPVAAQCASFFDGMHKQTGDTTLRVVVTRSAKWGTVWRSDSSVPLDDGEPPMRWRNVCAKQQILTRPLEMFDPTQSIPTLDEAMRTTHPTTPR
jgi:hypothetical protein